MSETRRCSRCGNDKPIDEFRWRDKAHTRRQSCCASCQNELRKAQYHSHGRSAQLERRFGINLQQFEDILAKQNGVCAICRLTETAQHLSVDHDHTTGIVRGLLCSNCNRALGFLRDDPSTASSAAAYLARHKEDCRR